MASPASGSSFHIDFRATLPCALKSKKFRDVRIGGKRFPRYQSEVRKEAQKRRTKDPSAAIR